MTNPPDERGHILTRLGTNLSTFVQPILDTIERNGRPEDRDTTLEALHARSATPEGFLSAASEQLLHHVPEHRRAEALDALAGCIDERLEALATVVDSPDSEDGQYLAALWAGTDIAAAAHDLNLGVRYLPAHVPLREHIERTAAERAAAMPRARDLPRPGSARDDTAAALRAARPPEIHSPAVPGSAERDPHGSNGSAVPGRVAPGQAPRDVPGGRFS